MRPDTVNITFQGPDWSRRQGERPDSEQPEEYHITVAGFDLDYGSLTVYTNTEDGDNLRLAERSPMCNEELVPLREIGWRIDPEDELLRREPLLYAHVGEVYGRVIVTAGGFAVDDER